MKHIRLERAISSHVGMVRNNNQDSGYLGQHLLFVADGMGGHAGGDVASALVTRDIAQLDQNRYADSQEAETALRIALTNTGQHLVKTVQMYPELSGMGTTFTGIYTLGDRFALAHIGDSRLYLLRDGRFQQLTTDHTFVQKLVESGRITEEEAKVHPRRSVLMRVLGDVESLPEIDTEIYEMRPGDRWLVCTDGLCGYVNDRVIERELSAEAPVEEIVDVLIDRALENGAPDNVTVAVMRVYEAAEEPASDFAEVASVAGQPVGQPALHTSPNTEGLSIETAPVAEVIQAAEQATAVAAGSITDPVENAEQAAPAFREIFVGAAIHETAEEIILINRQKNIARRRGKKNQQHVETHFEPRIDEYLAEILAESRRRNWKRRIMWVLTACALVLVLAGSLFLAYQWTQTRYYVGTNGTTVIIYRGIQQNIAGISLSSQAEDTGIPLNILPEYKQRQIERTLSADSLEEARAIVLRIGGEQ